MNFIEFLKEYDNFDKYILFMLSLDFTVQEVSEKLNTSRQNVYNVIERNKNIKSDYGEAVAGIVIVDDDREVKDE